MTEPQSPHAQPKAEEISLEDLDKILEAEDPEFTKSLEQVRNVEVDKNVTIEASVADEDGFTGESQSATADKPEGRVARFRRAVRMKMMVFRTNMKARLVDFAKSSVIWLRTRPKEYVLYSIAVARILAKQTAVPVGLFRKADRPTKITVVVLVTLAFISFFVLVANFKGRWLPHLYPPVLTSLETHADFVATYNPKEDGESFYSAFPQERHEFLFKRMKVNLRRTREHPLPMGAFELVVLVDSKDAAIEVRDREVELSDLLQRVFEDLSFSELESDSGKNKAKALLKKQLNERLTQGWAKEISFKTFVLKP